MARCLALASFSRLSAVNHDYEAAPIGKEEKHCPLELAKGMTLCVGAVASTQLNHMIEAAAASVGVPVQRDVRGRDTGADPSSPFQTLNPCCTSGAR